MRVSESSVKRWCDRGLIPARKTAGGHRRIAFGDLLGFVRTREKSTEVSDLLGLGRERFDLRGSIGRAAGAFATALSEGREAICREFLFQAYLAGHRVAVIADQLVVPALYEISQRADSEIYRESRAHQICRRLVNELRGAVPLPKTDAPRAIGATPEGDPYSLATLMVEVVLRESGWDAQSLGPSLPFDTMVAAVRDYRPQLVWLSVSRIGDDAAFLTGYQHFFEVAQANHAAVVVGGRALTEDIRRNMRYTSYCDNLVHLETFISSLVPRRFAG